MKKNIKLKVIIFVFLIVSVLYPLVNMILNISWEDFNELLSSKAFLVSLTNSLSVTSISTAISVLIAYLLAYSLNRTNIKHRAVLKVLLTLPMLIPSISHGLGLINLFGKNGIISSILHFNIIGETGVILGSILYSFPVAFLMLDDSFNYIDNSLYDSAKVLGLSKWQTFRVVTLTYLKKSILSAIFAVFTMIFTDYGVPLAVGGKFITLPVFLYKEVIGLLNFSKGTIISLFLLIPAFVSFMFDTLSKDYAHGEFSREIKIEKNKIRDIILTIFVYLVLLFTFSIIGSFVYYAFIDNYVLNNSFSLVHFNYVFSGSVSSYIFNSLLIAILVSILGTVLAYFAAYITARTNGIISKIVHIMTISSLAIPGIVLGLSYTISFKGTFIYNTYLILILVNIVHFIASPYLMAYNALQKINPNYEVVAKTCNIGILNIIKDVIIPCTKKTIREMLAYFFVNSMITISAVTFLFNTRTMPLSLLINDFESNLMLGEAAIVSLIILFFNCVVKGSIYIINRIEHRRSDGYEINV